MRRLLLFTCWTLALIAGSFSASAAESASAAALRANPRHTGTPLMRVWQPEDYGAALLNHRLIVHPNGLVYVANDDGVLEFDGARWRLIRMPREGAARSLAVDAGGRIWVFGHDDAARLEPDSHGELQAVSIMSLLPPDARATGTIHRAVVTADGVYARGQRRLMLFRPDGTVKTWPVPNLAGLIWTLDGVLYADFDQMVRVRPDGIEPVSFGADAKETLRVFAAEPTGGHPGEALLLTMRGPLLWHGPGTPLQPLPAATASPFGSDLAAAGVFLLDGRLALGSERSGVFIFARDGRLLQHIDRTQGLPGNRISELAVDADGGLWVATQEGLARLDVESPLALHGEAQGLVASPRRFATWRDQLYLSTADGAARRDPATGRFVSIPGFRVGTNRPLVVGDRLVFATRGLVEVTADDRSHEWMPELIGPIVPAVRSPGWIYAGASAGLWLLRPDAKQQGWEAAGRLNKLSLGIDELLDRGDGWLWAITREGEVARVDVHAGPRLDAPNKVFTPAEGVPEAGRNDHVQLLTMGGDLMAAGAGWLRRYDPAADRFEPETRLALDGKSVRGVHLTGPGAAGGGWFRPVEDPARLLHAEPAPGGTWQVTTHSIAPLAPTDFASVFEEAGTHTLWLAGQGLLASIDLAWRPSQAPRLPHALIRRVETESGALLWSGDAGDRPLTLTAEQNALRIVYAAPAFAGDYHGRSQTLYRTRLEGLDRGWSSWTTDAHRDFTNLPYRSLRFHVEARTADQPAGTEAVLAFAIAPPWWLTSWAFALYAALGAAIIYGGFKIRTAALRRQNEQLEAVVASRTRQLERINQELTDAVRIVSHDLRGPVSGIRSLARQMRATPRLWTSTEGPEFLGEIERTSGAAVDMMTRLLDLQRASDRAAGLVLAPVDLGALVQEICDQFAPTATARQIALRVEAPSAVRLADAEGVASIVANLVANAIKFLPEQRPGLVAVVLACDDHSCRLTVTDNGPGIPPAEREAVFEKFRRGQAQPAIEEVSSGLGLYIVRKLVTAMRGTIAISDATGGGATFTVIWPAARPGNDESR